MDFFLKSLPPGLSINFKLHILCHFLIDQTLSFVPYTLENLFAHFLYVPVEFVIPGECDLHNDKAEHPYPVLLQKKMKNNNSKFDF